MNLIYVRARVYDFHLLFHETRIGVLYFYRSRSRFALESFRNYFHHVYMKISFQSNLLVLTGVYNFFDLSFKFQYRVQYSTLKDFEHWNESSATLYANNSGAKYRTGANQ